MADRTLHLFATSEEVGEWIRSLGVDGVLVVAQDRDRSLPPQSLGLGEHLIPSTRSIYVGFDDLSDGTPEEVVENPGAHAWVRLVAPCLVEGVLLQATVDIRTQSLTHDNPDGVLAFNRVASRLRPALRYPTWVWTQTDGAVSTARTVAHTDAATALFDEGVEWMQEGVLNTRFGPRPPDKPLP